MAESTNPNLYVFNVLAAGMSDCSENFTKKDFDEVQIYDFFLNTVKIFLKKKGGADAEALLNLNDNEINSIFYSKANNLIEYSDYANTESEPCVDIYNIRRKSRLNR